MLFHCLFRASRSIQHCYLPYLSTNGQKFYTRSLNFFFPTVSSLNISNHRLSAHESGCLSQSGAGVLGPLNSCWSSFYVRILKMIDLIQTAAQQMNQLARGRASRQKTKLPTSVSRRCGQTLSRSSCFNNSIKEIPHRDAWQLEF